MGTLYTPKELAKIYNGIKIRYNPSGYSFKDRLTEHDSKACRNEMICEVDFDTEDELMAKIQEFWKADTAIAKVPGLYFLTDDTQEEFLIKWHKLYHDRSLVARNLEHSASFVSSDSLMFNPYYLCKNLSSTEKDFKKSHLLDTLVTVCYMCTTPYSVCSDLKWSVTNIANMFSYENLHSLQYLKEALESKDTEHMYVEGVRNTFYNANAPVIPAEGAARPSEHFANDTGLVETVVDSVTYKIALEAMYYETIAFGLEIAYLINTRTDTSENCKMYALLTGSMCDRRNFITELMYQPCKDIFIPSIELSEDPEARFSEICAYLRTENVKKAVELASDLFMRNLGYTYIPSLFGAVISFAKNYSCRTIRIKQCAILYNYCKANKLLKKDMDTVSWEDDDEIPDDATSTFESAVKEAAGASESSVSKKMLELERADYGKSKLKSTTSGGHDSTSVSQALDGLIGNFRADRYKFTVKDVYSEDNHAKTRYEHIAANVKLVNAQLIKQIRDIKTYNVGGKYSGLTSGKLDRKNLYKYKTDKNIFYQNTYKQKECDLAIGIMLDASGSMSGHGIEDGRTTMIVLHETLKALGINHCIMDHTCYGSDYQCDLRRYQCFREDKGYRIRKNYALANITAEAGNCDSGALWFLEKALLRTKNKDKICLIFSDGAPTECSGTDLVEQVRHMERHGIKVIGIGIGFPNISRYYSDYANGNNLKQMLDIVANILKEYVLTKKD